jgi:hypothetical protein
MRRVKATGRQTMLGNHITDHTSLITDHVTGNNKYGLRVANPRVADQRLPNHGILQ